MLNTTAHIKRTLVLAGALAATAAPSASARVADAPIEPSGSVVSRSAEPAASSPMAEMAARREALATKQWQAANPRTIVEVSPSADGGLDPASIGIGAAVPLTLVAVEVLGKWVLRRRRRTPVQHGLA